MGGTCSAYGGEERRIRRFEGGGRPKAKRLLERPRRKWEDLILRMIFRKWDVGVWTGSSWLRIGTAGEHL